MTEMFSSLTPGERFALTIILLAMVGMGFFFGVISKPFVPVDVANNPYVQSQSHFPGTMVERPPYNYTCNAIGNEYAQHLDQLAKPGTVRAEWLGGSDASFVAAMKIHSDDGREDVVFPKGNPGDCAYMFNVSKNTTVTVYGQNSVTGEWVQLGSG